MDTTPNMSLISLVSHASILAQVVLLLLLGASVVSWAVIIQKRKLLKTTDEEAERFEDKFWSGGNLADLFEAVRRDKTSAGLASIFSAGYEEYSRQQTAGRMDPDDSIAAIQRQMRVAQVREVDRLEMNLSLLA